MIYWKQAHNNFILKGEFNINKNSDIKKIVSNLINSNPNFDIKGRIFYKFLYNNFNGNNDVVII
jgi:hypothetical protein